MSISLHLPTANPSLYLQLINTLLQTQLDIKFDSILDYHLDNNLNNDCVAKFISNLDITKLNNSNIFIKIPKDINKPVRYLVELFIGISMNKLSKRCPNFVQTYGLLDCKLNYNKETNYKSFQILQQKISGMRLSEYIDNETFNINVFFNILINIAFALAKAQEKIGFVHNTLYPENILLIPTTLSSIDFKFGKTVYNLKYNKYIPVIIDFSSSRAVYDNISISFYQNPTVFTPGMDLFKLINSCLARLSNTPFFDKIVWINNFFRKFYDITAGHSYDYWFEKFNKFNIDDDNPVANLTPLNFIEWIRNEHGELFENILTISPRTIIPKKYNINKDNTKVSDIVDNIKSGIIKKYCYALVGNKYDITTNEMQYDEKLMFTYLKNIDNNIPQIYSINYNFPLNQEYNNIQPINYLDEYIRIKRQKEVLDNFIIILRYMLSINILPSKFNITNDIIQTVFENKEHYKINLMLIRNLIFAKIYKLCKFIESKNVNEDYYILITNIPLLVEYVKILFPDYNEIIISFIKQLEPIGLKREQLQVDTHYFPTYTLSQFRQLFKKYPIALNDLIYKFFRNKKCTEYISDMLDKDKNDIDIMLGLRQFHDFKEDEFDRGGSRSKDIKLIVNNIENLYEDIKINSYLDFGGSDGSISSAIADSLNIDKSVAYSADIEKWFSRKIIKKQDNITYLILKPNQRINLPDNSIDLITCFQVLHHIENIDFVLKELYRISNGILIIREHDCENINDKMLCDLEHSIYEITMEQIPNIRFLNDYEAWYKNKSTWNRLLETHGFKFINIKYPTKKTPTKYYYASYKKV